MDLPAPDAHTLHRDENPPISAQLKSVNLRKRFSSPLRFSQIHDTRAGFASGECPCKAPSSFFFRFDENTACGLTVRRSPMSVCRRRLKKGNKPATTPRVSVPKNARFPTRVTFEDFNFGRSNKEVNVLTRTHCDSFARMNREDTLQVKSRALDSHRQENNLTPVLLVRYAVRDFLDGASLARSLQARFPLMTPEIKP